MVIFSQTQQNQHQTTRIQKYPDNVSDIPLKRAAVHSVLEKAHPDVLLHIQSVFPFDVVPNSLIIDFNTITIIHRGFPPTEHIETIPIDVITDVSVNRGVLMSTLVIVAANLRSPITMSVDHLRPHDALNAHRVIECLMAIKRPHIEKGLTSDFSNATSILN